MRSHGDNQFRSKHSVIRVFSRLDDLYYSNTSPFPPPLLRPSSSSHLAPSSWILIKITSFPPVLKGFSMVKYPFCYLPCSTLAKEVQLIPGIGLYSGILAIYFQCQSKESSDGRTTTIVVYAICPLYVLSTLSFVSDFVALILEVSNNYICSKNIIFYQLCRHVLPRQIFFPLKMSKSYYPVVVTSSLKVS